MSDTLRKPAGSKNLMSIAASNRLMRIYNIAVAASIVVLAGCAAGSSGPDLPDIGRTLQTGLQRQVIRPEAPADRTPADGLPGELASKIYKKRYVKTMTEKENKTKDGKASREFQ